MFKCAFQAAKALEKQRMGFVQMIWCLQYNEGLTDANAEGKCVVRIDGAQVVEGGLRD
jgi:hypothetical protein